ncbi:hypothetical protein INT47_012759 [Mucor saturninus]|uniref:Uncharacterized protein n=1 Tax=Mucor saturninus TaxID=64648 RepID=A0A8H7QRQ8_9FUNG|nr:hypothetical protein INT47_012759 [Mucor saturninus]
MEKYTDYQKTFEIEERVQFNLPVQYHQLYQTLRKTSASTNPTRIPSTPAREQHWNKITTRLVEQYIEEFSSKTINNAENQGVSEQQETTIMAENHTDTAIGKIIAEAIQSGISRALELNNNNRDEDQDFYSKPFKYNGDRDRFKIDNWISSIDDYQAFRGWDNQKIYRFAKTLLIDMCCDRAYIQI